MTRTLKAAAIALLAIALPHSAIAQSFPTKPVHIVVAFAPGGPVDVVAWLIATSEGREALVPPGCGIGRGWLQARLDEERAAG